eukprot:sb/3461968/
MSKESQVIRRKKVQKFVYDPNSEADESSPTSLTERHVKSAERLFYGPFLDAFEQIESDNSTKLDCYYLKFIGWGYEEIMLHRLAPVLTFLAADPQPCTNPFSKDGIVCLYVDKDTQYWCTVARAHPNSGNIGLLLLPEITKAEVPEVVVALTTLRRRVLALVSGQNHVLLALLRESRKLDQDIVGDLKKVLLGEEPESKIPHYMRGAGVESHVEEGSEGKPLNEGQKEAVKECKENLLAVVQGPPAFICLPCSTLLKIVRFRDPPAGSRSEGYESNKLKRGTGKSYLTMCVVKSLASQEAMPPILFITVKNTVLDATLLKLLEDIPKERVVRLGRGYDETDPRIREVAFSDPGRERQKSGQIKGKKFKEIMGNLENAKSNIERVFKLADEARCLSLEELWGTFKDEQKIDFKQNHGFKTSYLASKMREVIPLDGLKEWASGLKEWLRERRVGSEESVRYNEDEQNRSRLSRRDWNVERVENQTVKSNQYSLPGLKMVRWRDPPAGSRSEGYESNKLKRGTGKSYLTMCVVKSLASQEAMPPILFITVKNTVLDATLLKLLEDIPKERVVRLGRGYDETDPRIREVAFSDPGRERQKSGQIKGKKFKEIMGNLENAKSNIERVFKLADEARCLSLEELWGTFKDEQKMDFKQNHGFKNSYLASKMREVVPLDGLKEWAKGLKEWLRERRVESEESVIYNEDEQNRSRLSRRDWNVERVENQTVKSNQYSLPGDEDGTVFFIDDFPDTWQPRQDPHKITNLWCLAPEDRLMLIFSTIIMKIREAVTNLESYYVKYHIAGEEAEVRMNKRLADQLRGFSVVAATVHGAILHKHALTECGVVAVVCEEASQVAERDLLVALPRSTLHLILIGI